MTAAAGAAAAVARAAAIGTLEVAVAAFDRACLVVGETGLLLLLPPQLLPRLLLAPRCRVFDCWQAPNVSACGAAQCRYQQWWLAAAGCGWLLGLAPVAHRVPQLLAPEQQQTRPAARRQSPPSRCPPACRGSATIPPACAAWRRRQGQHPRPWRRPPGHRAATRQSVRLRRQGEHGRARTSRLNVRAHPTVGCPPSPGMPNTPPLGPGHHSRYLLLLRSSFLAVASTL